MRFTRPTAVAAAAFLFAACDTGPVIPDTARSLEPIPSLPVGPGEIHVDCPSMIAPGSSGQCYAYINGSPISGADWSSSAPGVVSIGHYGNISGVSEGTAMITADWGGKSGFAYVTVQQPFTVSISGPDWVGHNQTCSWYADIRGAPSSTTITWSASGATGWADGPTWVGSSNQNFFSLSVTVTSGGQTRTASKWVEVWHGFLAPCNQHVPIDPA